MNASDPRSRHIGPDHPRWTHRLGDGRGVLIRPIGKHDAAAERAFIETLSPESRRYRFLAQIAHPDARFIEKLTDIDYVDDMALVAVVEDDGREKIVGVSRYAKSGDGTRCECAVVVADAWQGHGLGTVLMKHLIGIARERGIAALESVELAENARIRHLAKALGFHARIDPQDADQVIYTLPLNAVDAPPP